MMVYYTGDTHGKFEKLFHYIYTLKLTKKDVIVILGDAGFNYDGNDHGDLAKKRMVNKYGVKIFCIHGNHEQRPANISTYKKRQYRGGKVWYEPDFPNIVFAKDGEIYDFDGKKTIVIGGAYSVDKWYRIKKGYKWFADEQPSAHIKKTVEKKLAVCNWHIDQVLTHTCPAKYTPVEAFLSGVDQSKVDKSTEEWLDEIENYLHYDRWLCGHWHIDKTVDKLRFVMDDLVI